MSSCRRPRRQPLRTAAAALLAALAGLTAATAVAQPGAYPNLGRAATAKELAAWDVDVRPDFKGLPKGSGTVAKGQDIWEAKCATCHGVFGESNEVFSPLIGGTTQDDIATGRVARLNDTGYPGRTTLMKLASLSTVWDYIARAMPWTAPKSLSVDEVYSVTAYLLNLAGVLGDNATLSDANIAEAQSRLPNRNGMTVDHGLWPGQGMGNGGRADIAAQACMRDCAPEPRVASSLPDFARNSHGNLADQQRLVGAQRGATTTRPAPTSLAAAAAIAVAAAQPAPAPAGGHADALALLQKNGCTACHGVEQKIIGPAYREVATRHGGRADAAAYLAGKIKAGGQGVWGAVAMPPQALPDADARRIADWIAAGAKP